MNSSLPRVWLGMVVKPFLVLLQHRQTRQELEENFPKIGTRGMHMLNLKKMLKEMPSLSDV
jgi:hypothetical protein